MLRVLERFSITGRGAVVVLDGVTDLPVGRPLTARVERPDGTRLDAVAYKEWLLRRGSEPIESEAFLLASIEKAAIPDGGLIAVTP